MINLGGNWGVQHWDDSWTATTIDGKRSAQFEETLLFVPLFLMLDAVVNTPVSQHHRVRRRNSDGRV